MKSTGCIFLVFVIWGSIMSCRRMDSIHAGSGAVVFSFHDSYMDTLRDQPAEVMRVFFPKGEYLTIDCGCVAQIVNWECYKVEGHDTIPIYLKILCPGIIFGQIRVDSIYTISARNTYKNEGHTFVYEFIDFSK